jgi:hypothetical protein
VFAGVGMTPMQGQHVNDFNAVLSHPFCL